MPISESHIAREVAWRLRDPSTSRVDDVVTDAARSPLTNTVREAARCTLQSR